MKRIRLVVILIILVAIISTGVWWLVNSGSSETSTDILTSGFIEATNVSIAPEIGGRIVSIGVDEGSEVKAGVPLVRLDDSLLKAQQRQAEVAIEQAKAAVKQAQAVVEQAKASLEQTMMSRNRAIVNRDGAKKVYEDTLDIQRNPLELDSRIVAAQGELDRAELNLERKHQADRLLWPAEWDWEHRTALLQRDTAKKALDALIAIRNNPQTIDVQVDTSFLAYQEALAAVEVAERAVGVSQRAKEVAEAQVAVAQKQVEQSQASAEVIQVQLNKTALLSPVAGVVSARNFEVGELAQPGAPIITITELDKVTLIAYVPESKIGLVKLGQEALVSVDSYPKDSFSGKVVYISSQAQFTPRNVQLKEEREKTVFAVKIRLDNPDRKLKPGMPADARIISSSEG